MYSPFRASTSFTDTRLRSLIRSQDSAVSLNPGSFLTSETTKIKDMAESFSKTMREKIRQEVMKSPGKKTVSFGEDPEKGELLLLKRGEDYAKHVLGQLNRSSEEKDSQTAKIRTNVNRALSELDSLKSAESARLQSRVSELKKSFQVQVTHLERNLLKQIETLRTQFSEDIRNEELESFRRIKQGTEDLAASIAPETKKSVLEKVFGGVPEPVKPSKNRSLSAKRVRFNDYNTPEKKKLSLIAMQKLSESRKKVMQLNSGVGEKTESDFFSTPNRRTLEKETEPETREEDFEDLERSGNRRYLEDV